ncbi:MAG: phosphopyruvate hydratase [Chloroflexi bacterium]|nr:phosphopyruvate hydratase [Chloroflexota bacterium]
MARIATVLAREVLDSRGNPTVEVDVTLDGGQVGRASVPSGASTGTHEAVELRDGDAARYGGKGVRRAVANVVDTLGPALIGRDPTDQRALDALLIELDGTSNKGRLGANAILGCSLAVARAAALVAGVPLYRHIAALAGVDRTPLPLPMVNIISGGLHAGGNIDLQDFLMIPVGAGSMVEALAMTVAVYRATGAILRERGITTLVGDEGGYGPPLASNEAALEVVTTAIVRAGYRPGEQVAIAIDVASTHFHTADGGYALLSEGRTLTPAELIDLLADWVGRYPVVSIEDGLAEDDWAHWPALTARLGARAQIIGDDFFTTNRARVERGIAAGAANAVLVKMNQIGTLTETLDVVALCRQAGYRTVISARSGETEDDFLADLAVGCAGGQIKIGSIVRSERLAKYNQLLRIEEQLGAAATFAGRSALAL